MPSIITFIGWHNSGKTTLASKVVAELIRREIRVAVVKSTKESAIQRQELNSNDTAIYIANGAPVLLAAPDQIILQQKMEKQSLQTIASRYFAKMDIVIGEGFKHEKGIAKIEVYHQGDVLTLHVDGVVALVMRDKAEKPVINGIPVFTTDNIIEITDFILQYNHLA